MPRRNVVHFQAINRNNLLRHNMNNNDARYPLIHMRDHLFHAAFVRLALIYAKIFSIRGRKIIEFLLLSLSFLSLVLLIYIHMAFVQTPSDCLAHVQDKWPRDGILRVEILREKLNGKYTLEKSYLKERKIRELAYEDLASYFYLASSVYDESEDYRWILQPPDKVEKNNATDGADIANDTTLTFTNNTSTFNATIDEKLKSVDDKAALPALTWSEDEYIMEFSLEYGFLKLNPSVRKQYNITVELVTLDPNVDKCFGGPLNNFILYNFLGYDEVLLASIKLLASKEEYKGYVRNVVTEVEFIFINAWMDRKSYITAGFVMMVFTVSISILLRYSHHQIFVFIVELLHMLEFHSSFNFPAGPLLTVILALVGMEAIMSEFFNDTAIAFYVILIVWMADQFDTICCKSYFTKKHWLKFFYLYHFFFYAYSYRFGHNRFLALLTSWLFTVHSMVYFFHRYELPMLVSRRHRIRNPRPPENNPDNPPGNDPGDEAETNTPNSTPDSSPESETSASSNGASISTHQNDDSTNDGQQINGDNHNLTNESRDREECLYYCEKRFPEPTEDVKHFYSELDQTMKDQELRSKSWKAKSIETVVPNSKANFASFINIITFIVLYTTIVFLFRNISMSLLNTYLKNLYSSLAFSKFIPRLRYLHI